MTQHYPVNLVGEQFYQPAVYDCEVGDVVDVCREQGNPVDVNALVVRTRHRPPRTIGYIPRDSFVQRVVHDQGLGLAAALASVAPGTRGFWEVRLLVSIVDVLPQSVDFQPGVGGEGTPAPDLAPVPLVSEPIQPSFRFGLRHIFITAIIVFVLARCMS